MQLCDCFWCFYDRQFNTESTKMCTLQRILHKTYYLSEVTNYTKFYGKIMVLTLISNGNAIIILFLQIVLVLPWRNIYIYIYHIAWILNKTFNTIKIYCNLPLCNPYQNMATTQNYKAIKTVHITNMSKPSSVKHCAMMPRRCL